MANQYDDTQLQKLFTEMDVKHRKRALKGAFRREANQVRRTAINNLRSSLHSNRDLEKGIRAIVFKKAAGFRVTIGTKKANRKTGKGEKGPRPQYSLQKQEYALQQPLLEDQHLLF